MHKGFSLTCSEGCFSHCVSKRGRRDVQAPSPLSPPPAADSTHAPHGVTASGLPGALAGPSGCFPSLMTSSLYHALLLSTGTLFCPCPFQ